jgi:hypothetical protein
VSKVSKSVQSGKKWRKWQKVSKVAKSVQSVKKSVKKWQEWQFGRVGGSGWQWMVGSVAKWMDGWMVVAVTTIGTRMIDWQCQFFKMNTLNINKQQKKKKKKKIGAQTRPPCHRWQCRWHWHGHWHPAVFSLTRVQLFDFWWVFYGFSYETHLFIFFHMKIGWKRHRNSG